MFSWHSDFSVLVIPLAGFLTWIVFRPKIFSKKNIPALFLLIFSFLPLLIFDLRHDFVNFKMINSIFSRFENRSFSTENINFSLFPKTMMRIIFLSPKNIQDNFAYNKNAYSFPKYPFLSGIIVAFSLFVFSKRLIEEKKDIFKMIGIFLITFLFGFFIHTAFYGGDFYQHYLTLLFPIFCLLFALGLDFCLKNKIKLPVYLFLASFLIVNLYVLFSAKVKHSTYEKIKKIKKVKNLLIKQKFAAYDFGFEGAGMHYLYLYHDLHPVKTTDVDDWYWVYMTHSLFDVAPEMEWPDKVLVMIAKDKGIKTFLLDNSSKWVTKQKLKNLD